MGTQEPTLGRLTTGWRRTLGPALKAILVLGALAALAVGLSSAPIASASHVAGAFVPGNPTCVGLGYSAGFKIDPPRAGTYTIIPGHSVTVTRIGEAFSWTSTLGIDAALAKGGPNANLYRYDPPAESFGDTNLHAPINPSNGQPFGLSHIEFCYDVESLALVVTKTAATSFKRTWLWSIDKSVSPSTWNLARGGSGTSNYTVAVTRTGSVDSNWAVSGSITVRNPAATAATVTGVSDTVSGGIVANVACPVALPHSLAAGATLTCTYGASLPDGSNRTNTVTVTTSSGPAGGSGTAAVTFGAPTTVVNGTVTITDSVRGNLGSLSDSGSFSYSRTFGCDGDRGRHDNTARIVETGQSDSASVTVDCTTTTPTPSIDLAIAKADNPDPVRVKNQVTYTLTVRNNGPSVATGVRVMDTLPGRVNFVSAASEQGSCSGAGSTVNCTIGTMAVGAQVRITVVVATTVTGTILNTAVVVGNESESNTANNTATEPTLVVGVIRPPAKTTCRSLTVTPRQLFVGRRSTIVARVTRSNNRPFARVRVRVVAPGLKTSALTGRRGVARIKVRPTRPGFARISVVNNPRCSTRKVGIVGVFQPPLTG